METALAKVRFSGLEDGESHGASDEEKETRTLVTERNKKGKKSGGFQSMGLSSAVFKGVMRKGYRVPTPIQRKCIPAVMDGKDVVAMARTGSGKTAAFLVPMFQHLKMHSAKIGARALILEPTRELATQTMKFAKELGRFTDLRCALILGGERMDDQFAAMHENPDIVIATPGRFVHLSVEMGLKLSSVEYVVFDEADRLFELGFADQLHSILKLLPESRQTLLFSATLPKMLVDFAKAGLKDPVLIRLDVDSKLSDQLKMAFLSVRYEDKAALLLYLMQHIIPSSEQTVVFTATRYDAEYLRELLSLAEIDSACVYSMLDQAARKINIAKFISKKVRVLLVTDVAARGIDIPALENVINYNFPPKPKLFVHRVGRVARAGRTGTAYSLVSTDEVPYLLDLYLFLGRGLQLAREDGTSEEKKDVFGSVPWDVLNEQEEFMKMAHSNYDVATLKRVADNGYKQYIKSRAIAAPESIKRSKELPSSLPVHTMFVDLMASVCTEKLDLLNKLKSYKPSNTIFEVHGTAKSSAKQVMKMVREHHEKAVVDEKRRKTEFATVMEAKGGVEGDKMLTSQLATKEDLQDFASEKDPVKGKHADKEYFLPHRPADFHGEKGLSLGSSFHQEATGAVLDLDGDENTDLRQSKAAKKWDRKRKKFVGESGDVKTKKIRTESGAVVKASYKTDAYQKWREKYKIDAQLAGEEQEGALPSFTAGRSRRGFGKRKFGGEQQKGTGKRGTGKRPAILKSKDVILKKRKQKETMEMRKKINQKKKQKKQKR